MKTILFTFLFLFPFMFLSAQPTFLKSFGSSDEEQSKNFIVTNDNGLAICGFTQTGNSTSQRDGYILKLDANGSIEWTKKLQNKNSLDEFKDIIQLADDSYVLLGIIENDILLVKMDNNTDIIWSRKYGGNGTDNPVKFIETNDSGFLIAAKTTSFGAGSEDTFVLKVDASGNVQWSKVFGGDSNDFPGGGLIQTPSGFLVTGSTNSYGGSQQNSFVLHLDLNGNLTWAKTYSGSGNEGFEEIAEYNGNYLCGGNTWSWASNNENFIVEIDGDGDIITAFTVGIQGKNIRNFSIKPFNNGFVANGFEFTGSNDDAYIYAMNNSFDIVWAKNYGDNGTERFLEINVFNNTIYGLGYTNSAGAGNNDVLVAKTDSNGEVSNCDIPDVLFSVESVNPSVSTFQPNVTSPSVGESINIDLVDFQLIEETICTPQLPPIADFVASETTICENECIDFTDQSLQNPTTWEWSFPGADITSSNLQNPTNICYANAGTYTVTLVVSNEAGSDSFSQTIEVLPTPTIYLGIDTSICDGDNLILDAFYPEATYQWSDGSTTSSIIVNDEGVYWVEVSIGDCTDQDTTIVSFIDEPIIDLGSDQTLCIGDTLVIDATGTNATNYLWQDDSTAPVYTLSTPGIYAVTVSNECYSDSDEISIIQLNDSAINIDLGADQTLCFGDSLVLNASNADVTNYQWQDGSSDPTFTVLTPGTYAITVSNQCFSDEDEIIITQEENCCNLRLPNAFTPDYDGVNDEFKAITNCTIISFSFLVFDRWGELVFETNDYTEGWDGKFKNKEMNQEVYAWIIEYNAGEGNLMLTGDVTLIR